MTLQDYSNQRQRDDFKQIATGGAGDTGSSMSRQDRRKKKRARRLGDTPTSATAPAPYSASGPTSGRLGTAMPGAPGTAGTYGNAPIAPSAPGSAYSTGNTTPSTTNAPGVANPPKIPLSGPFSDISQSGLRLDISNPNFFYSDQLGIDPSSYAANFYGNLYDPSSLATALGGGSNASNEGIIKLGQQLAGQLTGQAGLGGGLDPTYIISSLFSQFNKEASGGPLAAFQTMSPGQAFTSFIDLLTGAVKNILPEDTWNGLISLVTRYGNEYLQQWAHRPEETEKSGGNVIRYIASKLGPSFGLY